MAHSLRTRADIDNIRQAYDRSSSWSGEHVLHRASRPAQHRQTSRPSAVKRPVIHQLVPFIPPTQQYFTDRQPQESPVASTESLPSTTSSCLEELDIEQSMQDPGIVKDQDRNSSAAQSVPTTPHEFSTLFPSHRTIRISHDDSTLDGNMNLRLDTEVHTSHDKIVTMTLFHLRMQDLKDRAFSLRRYCRDSGREVCHSARKRAGTKQANNRPGLQRSWSSALSSVRAMSTPRRSLDSHMKREDSGYGSIHSTDHSPIDRADEIDRTKTSSRVIRLEFSNYAQVDIKRRGSAFNRRYEYEYWGRQYVWKRESKTGGSAIFHLSTRFEHGQILAHIEPHELSVEAEKEEQSKGGWVPPASMRIEDESILHGQKDLSDVVVATGLVALVDDAIQTHFVPPKVEYIGPKRLVNELLGRVSAPADTSNGRMASRVH
ncbi:hypothetical protein AMS68_006470 [Peltaster fructicola]|uniref:Uncharacterized protein n=1 Tax=Peltaster fructicola TaxID=286661 RepID=A0A6H0Y1R7_9PEZI|nr:hypothetical protein AMS68_006470 [Peltaster fructicola]